MAGQHDNDKPTVAELYQMKDIVPSVIGVIVAITCGLLFSNYVTSCTGL